MDDFDFGSFGNPAEAYKTIALLSAALCDAEGDVEAALALTKEQQRDLTFADKIELQVKASGEVGAANFAITGIEKSWDGTNWTTHETFASAITITANGHYFRQLTNPIIGAKKVRLAATVTTLDGSNKITLTAELKAVLRS